MWINNINTNFTLHVNIYIYSNLSDLVLYAD